MDVGIHAKVMANSAYPSAWLMLAGFAVLGILMFRQRHDWNGLSAIYPAAENLPDVPFRQFLNVQLWIRLVGRGPRRQYGRCVIGLEPRAIRIAHGRAARAANLEALIPWDEVDSFTEDSVRGGEDSPEIPVHRLRLRTRSDEILIGRPAGEAAWIQWRMVKAHGPGTPIIDA